MFSALAVVCVLCVSSITANAATPASLKASLQDRTIHLVGSGFLSATQVHITFAYDTPKQTNATADAQGSFAVDETVPDEFSGVLKIVARGKAPGPETTTSSPATPAPTTAPKPTAAPTTAPTTAPPAPTTTTITPDASRVWKIMPMGDSITGSSSMYRYFIYQRLTQAGIKFDFVGSNRLPDDGTPDPDQQAFDGMPLKTINGVRGHTDFERGAVEQYKPDIILLHSGTGDIMYGASGEQTGANLRGLLDELYAGRPDVYVVVAKIIPRNPIDEYDPPRLEYNRLIDGIVSDYKAKGKHISFADCAAGFTSADLEDQFHPNQQGSQKIADAFYPQLTKAMDELSGK